MAEYTIDKFEYDGNVYKLQDNVSGYAPLASPALTGTPTAPTATSGDSSTKIATTAFVQDAMSGAGTVTSVGVNNDANGGLSVSGSPITSSGTITLGHSNVLTSAQTTSAVYPIKIDKNGHISEYGSAVTVPSITLNGSSTTSPSFYAPTTAGTSGYVLTSSGSGAPTWSSAVLTDENLKWTASTSTNKYYPLVSTSTATTSTANTLNGIDFYQNYNTLGGFRRLSLGNSTSYKSTGGAYGMIRLYGSATSYGDLIPGVLGTTSGDGHISATRTWTLPNKTGTIALTSDLPTVPTNVSAFTNDAGYITGGTSTPTASTVAEFDSSAHMNSGDMSAQDVSNFVSALYMTGTRAIDYIVEESTSGIWRYRKWNSGVAECWGEYYNASETVSTGSGNFPYQWLKAILYPFEFTNYPIVSTSAAIGSGYAILGKNYPHTDEVQVLYYASDGTTVSVRAYFYIIGTWK